MNRILSIALSLLFGHALCGTPQAVAQADQTSDPAITIKEVTNGSFFPRYLHGVRPMNDGESYTRLSSDGKRIVRSSFKTGKETGVLFDADKARGNVKLNSIDGYIMSPDEKKILLRTQTRPVYRRTSTAIYYIYDTRNATFSPLSEGGAQMSPLFSPDGNVVAFARDNNLFVVKLLYNNAETQVTKDGKRNAVINGIPDWVNEEEFSTDRSFEFSADGEMLCWIRYDETQVPVYRMQMFKGLSPERQTHAQYPGTYDYKYPIAGQTNSTVTLHSYDLKSRATRRLNVPLDADGYIPRIAATSDPARLAVVTLNRHQNRMDLYMVNPRSGVAKLALRETNEKYLRETAYTSLRFYDGHFAMLSERSGFQHLYWYTLNGNLEATVTKGNHEVSHFHGYDAQSGRFFFSAHRDSPLQTAVYSADKHGNIRRLTPEKGTHTPTFSKNYRYFINVHSALASPPATTLRNADGKKLATLIDNAELKQKVERLGTRQEFFQFTTTDGITLNGWMLKPRHFDPSRRYPVVMYQYSGPGSQEVKDAWDTGFFGGGVWESCLAEQGYISVIVDGRGTGARGADFEKCTYLRLGDLESKDQVETALHLATLPYVDASRIALWGWSFGGFNTLMAMTDGRPVFRCGVAVAAPSNWKYYDTVYTERYMKTPQENANYDLVNPIARASRLHGDLLLVHGTADDNVHYRNCTEMAEALVQAEKPFDMQVYTNRNHGIYGGKTREHLFAHLLRFFNHHMK
ncbi:S9 family peptidase [Alloprevotella sp. OH1205_COT-284]|nr:S9 family peptidase [Alloprevotella sp. OH1205_COT-284]RRD79677.1 S9 family peptidase [Alloprevotella sp. OH1205_COT-284]